LPKKLHKINLFLLLVFIYLLTSMSVSNAALELSITDGNIKPIPIAIPIFLNDPQDDSDIGNKISKVIANNLANSGLFYPINPKAFIEKINNIDQKPDFQSWRIINSEELVIAKVVALTDDTISIKYRLFDVINGKELTAQILNSPIKQWRRIAHLISDSVYERLTGEKGYFDTQVAFVAESGSKTNRIKRLAIMDQDGNNPRHLTKGDSLVLTPRFSPTSQEIAYLSYANGIPQVYIYKIDSKQTIEIGSFPGMTFAPRFSPDGKKIIMSLQQGVGSNIYEIDLTNYEKIRLTDNPDIDTAPSYSPDAKRITFESDRSGSQQIYVMDVNGKNVKRISFGKGSYSTPVWSPRGDYIAFTRMYQGRFMIGVMFADGTGERIITDGYHNEGPTWAPNGRVLMFFREVPGEKGGANIYSVDITGYNERLIKTPGYASDPAWSPLMN
jgi:TolB protein